MKKQFNRLRFSFLVVITCLFCWVMPTPAQVQMPTELNHQGQTYYSQGQFEQAFASWQAAVKAYKGDHIGIAGSQINQAQALSAMGFQRRACKVLFEALEMAPSRNQRLCDPVPFQATIQPSSNLPNDLQSLGLRNLGEILRLIGNLDTAQTILLQSWRLAPESLKPDVLLSLGNVARDLGNRDRDRTEQLDLSQPYKAIDCIEVNGEKKAVDYYYQAIACYQQVSQTHKALEILKITPIQSKLNVLNLIVDIDQWLERTDQIEQKMQWRSQWQSQVESLTEYLQIHIPQLTITYESLFAQINFARSLIWQTTQGLQVSQIQDQLITSTTLAIVIQEPKLQLAWQLLNQTIQSAKILNSTRLEAYATGNLGWFCEQLERWSEGLQWTEKALSLASRIQASDLIYQWDWQKGRILKQTDRKAAITAYEQAIQALQATRANLIATHPDAQFSVRDAAEPVYRELIDLLLEPQQPSQLDLKRSVELVDSLRLAELEDFLRCELAAVRSVSVEQVNDPTAAIFYPIVLRDRVEIILRLPMQSDLIRYRSKVTHREFNQQIQKFKQQLETPESGVDVKVSGKKVYDQVLRDAQPYLDQAQIKTLVFVPDGWLRNIPLASLYDGNQFLIEKYAIAITPGLEILGPKRIAPRQLNALLAGLSIERQITVNGTTHTFKALPNVVSEIQQIQAALEHTDTLINTKFTTQALQKQASGTGYPLVHLATHGKFSSDPSATYLLTASEQPMTLDQMRNLLQARNQQQVSPLELLVFSACETASGDQRATLGLAGMAVQSGALGTIASLWSVDDASTAMLMGQFYQNLAATLESRPKAEALRQAQLGLLQNPNFSHPYYWSPFILVGNWL